MTFIGPRPDTPIGSAAYTDEEKIILQRPYGSSRKIKIENSIGYGYRMRKIIEHAKISLRQKAVEYYGWSYIRSMFA